MTAGQASGKSPSDEPENIAALLADRVQKAPEKLFLFSEADGRQFTYARIRCGG